MKKSNKITHASSINSRGKKRRWANANNTGIGFSMENSGDDIDQDDPRTSVSLVNEGRGAIISHINHGAMTQVHNPIQKGYKRLN